MDDVFAPTRKMLAEARETLNELHDHVNASFMKDAEWCRNDPERLAALQRSYNESWQRTSKPLVDTIVYLTNSLPPRMIVRADGVLEHIDPATINPAELAAV